VRKTTRSNRSTAATADDRGLRWFMLQILGWSHRDAVAFTVVAIAAIAVMVNGLMFQTGTHPAPMFKGGLTAAATVAPKDSPVAALPRARPVESVALKTDPLARPSAEVVSDIQNELTRRGFYDGAVDGRYGSRTDAAIRDFEQAAGLKPSTEPNEGLLAAIKRSNAKSTKATTAAVRPAAAQPVHHDPIAEVLAPSKRILAVQRTLAEYGYGQIRPTGVVDPETRAAIEKFERERKLPITGQVSDRVTRELASITGRPLE
jgi:peptidoglycan hydrolase-like protein with peptidoglycan-binding domain